ncbi:hypothetical protein, partial [Isoptericola sp. NPDC057391]|uniref:hypothetical protein n=1 Tax=Isoptericola sp. NPDC057391 TaxID=3346117 RepID=UPI00362EDCCC
GLDRGLQSTKLSALAAAGLDRGLQSTKLSALAAAGLDRGLQSTKLSALAAAGLDRGLQSTKLSALAAAGLNQQAQSVLGRFYAASSAQEGISRYLHGIQGLGGLARPAWLDGFKEMVERRRRQLLPQNLHDVDVTVADLSRLADEGITLWAIPNPKIVQQLVAAPTYGARREVLGRRGRVIIDDCAQVAAYAVGGRYAPLARELEQAISAERAGFVGPALSHVASILDTLMRDEIESRADIVRHKPTKKQPVMDHFDELDLGTAMVFRPIWFAYRPMYTREERARSTSFARHAVAHGVTGTRVVSFRNFVQATMLAAALISFLSWWTQER